MTKEESYTYFVNLACKIDETFDRLVAAERARGVSDEEIFCRLKDAVERESQRRAFLMITDPDLSITRH